MAEAALLQMMAGDLQRAGSLFREALAAAPNDIDTLINYGALLQHRGHLHEAARVYREVLAQDADEIEVRCNLAKALADRGEFVDALRETDIAIERSGGQRGSMAARGAVLIDAEDYAEAERFLAKAIADNPADDMTLVNLALCCEHRDDSAAAGRYLMRAVELNPHNARAVADLVICLSGLRQDDQALRLAEGFLAEHPGERLVVGSYAQALLNAGHETEAKLLTDAEALVQVSEPGCGESFAPDFAGAEAFHAALAAELTADPSLLQNPVSKATTGGLQTGELDLDASPAMRRFAHLINRAINTTAENYVAAGLAGHPVMQTASPAWCLRAWGTLINAGGRQEAHMHPLGWLSGVYYVQLPHDMNAGGEHDGWLEFGQPPARMACRHRPATRLIEPGAGRLVIFPSWLWHRTLPFRSEQQRISIAFDVMPLDGSLSRL